MFSSIWFKFVSVIMSFIVSFGTTFGIFVPATTTAPEDYLDSNIKNVIYTNNNLTTLKSYLNSDKIDKNIFTESFKNFIFKIKTKNTNENNGRIIIMFKDNTFASIVIGGV